MELWIYRQNNTFWFFRWKHFSFVQTKMFETVLMKKKPTRDYNKNNKIFKRCTFTLKLRSESFSQRKYVIFRFFFLNSTRPSPLSRPGNNGAYPRRCEVCPAFYFVFISFCSGESLWSLTCTYARDRWRHRTNTRIANEIVYRTVEKPSRGRTQWPPWRRPVVCFRVPAKTF